MSQPLCATPVEIYETQKNRVLIYEDRVCKTFGSARHAAVHLRREIEALRRLAGIQGVPVILALGLDRKSVVMSRVPGTPMTKCESVSERTMASLRSLVEQMLQRGIARHSLPPRDVIVAPDGSASLVDFERSTRRLFPGDPAWIIAKGVTRFHLMRMLHEHAPQLMNRSEQRRLRWHTIVRAVLQRPAKFRRRVLRALGKA